MNRLMSKLFLVLFLVVLLPISRGFVEGAETYLPVTKDEEVFERGDVVIKRTQDVQTQRNLSVNFIDKQISDIDKQILELQTRKATFMQWRIGVETEANKVILKTFVPEPDIDPPVLPTGQ